MCVPRRVLETDLAAARTRITQLEGQLKTRDKEVSGLQKLVRCIELWCHATGPQADSSVVEHRRLFECLCCLTV